MHYRPLTLTLFCHPTREDAESILQKGFDGAEEKYDACMPSGGVFLQDSQPISEVDRVVLGVHLPDRSAIAEYEIEGLDYPLWFVPVRLIQQIAVITLVATDDTLPHHGEGPPVVAVAPPVEALTGGAS